MKQNPTRSTGPGSMAARRKSGLTPLQQIQWGGHSDVDGRYQVDPKTFKGGEFMAEWWRLRGGKK